MMFRELPNPQEWLSSRVCKASQDTLWVFGWLRKSGLRKCGAVGLSLFQNGIVAAAVV